MLEEANKSDSSESSSEASESSDEEDSECMFSFQYENKNGNNPDEAPTSQDTFLNREDNKSDEADLGQQEEEEEEPLPSEMTVTNEYGEQKKLLFTASGIIPHDFSNTKIIKDGKVISINSSYESGNSISNITRVNQQQ